MTDGDLMEWFHQFADQSLDEIADQASGENRSRFLSYVTTFLPGHQPPERLPADAFAKAVLELRTNERGWNRALMSALIHADDLYRAGDFQGAASSLEEFSGACPWKLYQQVARNQAARYVTD